MRISYSPYRLQRTPQLVTTCSLKALKAQYAIHLSAGPAASLYSMYSEREMLAENLFDLRISWTSNHCATVAQMRCRYQGRAAAAFWRMYSSFCPQQPVLPTGNATSDAASPIKGGSATGATLSHPGQSMCFFSMARSFFHEQKATRTTRTRAAAERRNECACLTAISFSS